MADTSKRRYHSDARVEAAERTRSKVLEAEVFLTQGNRFDNDRPNCRAGRRVGANGLRDSEVQGRSLYALMHDAMFPRFQQARQKLEGVMDPVKLIG
jgi:hypothetical protein